MGQIDQDYILGELTANVKNLTSAVDRLTSDVQLLRTDLSEIKLFRAKLIGTATAVSAVVSGIVAFSGFLLKTWRF